MTSSMVGSCTSEIIFIVFSVTNFPHKWRHSRGGIFVVDQRKSDLQNSLFMILNHVRGSDIDFGKYLKIGKKNCLCLTQVEFELVEKIVLRWETVCKEYIFILLCPYLCIFFLFQLI